MSWTAIKNGELLTLGLKYFDAFVTTDRNLSFQKNLASFSIVSSWLRRGQTTSPISGLSYQTFWRSSSPLGAAPPVSLGHLRTNLPGIRRRIFRRINCPRLRRLAPNT